MKIYENLQLEDLDGEIWKEIEEYNGDYFISNLGRVKSFKEWPNINILKQIKDTNGYFVISLYKNGKYKNKYIHILMFEYFIKEIPEGYVIHHIDFSKDNILDNFQLMTKSEHRKIHTEGKNNPFYGKKRPEHSKRMSGENSPSVKLKEQDIIEIRKHLNEGILTQKEIAGLFNVNQTTISDIKLRKSWKYVK